MSDVLNVEKIFASKVFTVSKMKERLPRNVYKEVKKVMDQGGELSLETADVVAKTNKGLAGSHRTYQYTQWFTPHYGNSGEKAG